MTWWYTRMPEGSMFFEDNDNLLIQFEPGTRLTLKQRLIWAFMAVKWIVFRRGPTESLAKQMQKLKGRRRTKYTFLERMSWNVPPTLLAMGIVWHYDLTETSQMIFITIAVMLANVCGRAEGRGEL